MPRPRQHDDALAARLLEVASTVIAGGGVEALTVRDVAGRAGTSASAVYALFGSREALVHAVGEEAFRRFARHLAGASEAAPTGGDAGAHLLALGLAYRASAVSEPNFYRVMFATAGAGAQEPGALEPTGSPTFAVLREAVATVLGGRLSAEAATEAALTLWGLVHGLVSLEIAGLLPGDEPLRAARYERALRVTGGAVLAAVAASA